MCCLALPTPEPPTPAPRSAGMSPGAIAGLVIGVAVAFSVIVSVGGVLMKRRFWPNLETPCETCSPMRAMNETYANLGLNTEGEYYDN